MADFHLIPSTRGFQDLTGRQFGSLLVIGYLGNIRSTRHRFWMCRCNCGTEKPVAATNLVRGQSKSCGCERASRIGAKVRRHGLSGTKIIGVYHAMLWRCYHHNSPEYGNYGARGIAVCDRWKQSARTFAEDMGPIPGVGYSIDRINNSGNYEPSNCRWATSREQTRNMRRNRMIEYRGEVMCLADWAEHLDINYDTLFGRIVRYGWSIARAIETPVAVNLLRGRQAEAITEFEVDEAVLRITDGSILETVAQAVKGKEKK